MAEYIEREALIKKLKDKIINPQTAFINNILIGLLEKAPAADVVEVKHGYWKETITHNGCTWDSDCVCSVCGKSGHPCNNYCEECGAKMDGERRKEDG